MNLPPRGSEEKDGVVVPFSEYEQLNEIREQVRRREALTTLEKLREKVRARSQDLSGEEADALADRFSREIIEDMVQEGGLKSEPTTW